MHDSVTHTPHVTLIAPIKNLKSDLTMSNKRLLLNVENMVCIFCHPASSERCDACESSPSKRREEEPNQPKDQPSRTDVTAKSWKTTPAQASSMSTRKFVEAVMLVANRHDLKFCLDESAAGEIIEALMDTQSEFKAKSAPTHVTVGYHYTDSSNLSNIEVQSLLTFRTGRIGYYGRGLYTANNPGAFSNYGPTGLMCAVLKGVTKRIATGGMDLSTTMDTGIGNKHGLIDFTNMAPLYRDEYVLRSSQQCVPLICYYAGQDVLCDAFFARLQQCQADLQRLFDHFFNEATLTPPLRVEWPLDQDRDHYRGIADTLMQIPIRLPSPLFNVRTTGWFTGRGSHEFTIPAIFPYTAPSIQLLSTRAPCYNKSFTILTQAELARTAYGSCTICLSTLRSKGAVVKLLKCNHVVHQACLASSFKKCSTCPSCTQNLAELQGTSPSGVMSLKGMVERCAGYETGSTIVITYRVRGGTQEMYHPSTGATFLGTTREAFVPYFRNEGWDLLKRLIWAFQHGLTFKVGTSLTTGRPNVITWSSIPHKTLRTEGGEHGFPDATYFDTCNAELTNLGVPLANELEDAGMTNSDLPMIVF